jgi:hypothetical protein
MKKLLYVSVVSLALFCPSVSGATKAQAFRGTTAAAPHNLLNQIALNVTAASRTITLSLGNMPAGRPGDGFNKLRVFVFYTYSAATTVTALFSCSLDGTNYGSLLSRSIVSGASTVSVVTDTYTTGGANADLQYEYDVRGCASVQIVFGGASADGSDLVNVQAVAIGD